MSDDDEIEFPSDGPSSHEEIVDETKHGRLLDAISALDGAKRRVAAQRTEPTAKVSEFYVSAGQGKVALHDLVNSKKDGKLKGQLNRIDHNTKILPVPLPHHEREKIERTVAFENTKEELDKWDPIVEKNRKAEQLKFPLERPDIRMVTMNTYVKRFKPRTPLEVEVAKLLKTSDSEISKGQMLSKAEERALQAMSVEEAKARRAELQKYRALLSYKEREAHRKKKIKSKSYRRHLRKGKLKHETKAMEELQKTDPEAFEEKLQRVEREYVTERMSLKHRGGSKYMQKQIIYGKYDKDARHQVQEMLQKSKELTIKTKKEEDSDNDSDTAVDEIDVMEQPQETSNRIQVPALKNPWMSAVAPKSVQASSTGHKKAVAEAKLPESSAADSNRVSGNVTIAFHKQPETKDSEDDSDNDVGGDTNQVKDNKNEGSDEVNIQEVVIDKSFEKKTGKTNAQNKQKQQKGNVEPNKRNKEEKKKEKARDIQDVDIEKLFEKKTIKTNAKNKQQGQRGNVKPNKRNNMKPNTRNKKGKKVNEPELSESSESEMSESESEEEAEPLIMDSRTRKRTLEDMEGDWPEEDEGKTMPLVSKKAKSVEVSDKPAEVTEIDPSKFMALETSIRHTHHPEMSSKDSLDHIDPELEHRMTIAQAFASDDVVEEFTKEKAEIADQEKVKDIDLTLPGWGDWGGAGIDPSRKKRFIIKAPEAPPRKDAKIQNVIIREEKDSAISKHQVKNVPYLYKSVRDFESSIRAPIGKTWNPETAYRKMIQPDIVTSMGTIIEPIDKSATFKKHQKHEKSQGKQPHYNPTNKQTPNKKKK